MKKSLLTAAVIMFALGAFAQQKAGSLSIKPKFGINIADVTNDKEADTRIGLVFGAEAEYQVEENISISAGLLYSQQGMKGEGKYENLYIDATWKLDYISIPVLANVYLAKGFAVKCGIQPSFKINSKAKGITQGVTIETDMPGTKSMDFSIPLGVSYEYANVQLDARYNWGLTKINAHTEKSKNSVFQITLGYKFQL